MTTKAKRLRAGKYLYKGYVITCVGYYQPERRVVWEAEDEHGNGFAHSFSLRDTKRLIDDGLNKTIEKVI